MRDADRSRSRRMALLSWVGGMVAYAAVATWYTWAAISSGGTRFLGGPGDAELFMWYLRWTPFALSHHHNPLLTNYIHYPDIVNTMWNTSLIVPALIAWPLTQAMNVVQAYNILILLAFVLSASAAFLAFSRIVDSRLAAWLGGLAYGFCPYMLAHWGGHLFLLLAAIFPPLFLLLLDDLLRRRRLPAWLAGIVIGVVAAALLLTSMEVLATLAIVAAVVLVWLAVLSPSFAMLRSGVVRIAVAALPALICFAILAAFPLRTVFFGPSRVAGALQPPNTFVSDLLAFVMPPGWLQFNTPNAVAVTNRFTGDTAENNAYIGIAVLLLIALGVAVARRRRAAIWAAGSLIAIAVLSLGPRLHVGGTVTSIKLPWATFQHLPLLENVLPGRFMTFGYLFVGLLLALLVDAGVASRHRLLQVAAPVAVVVGLVTWLPPLPAPTAAAEMPAFFTAGGGVDAIPDGAPILLAPVNGTVGQRWQATSGMRFRQLAGAAWNPGPTFGPAPTPLLSALSALELGSQPPPLTAAARAALLADLDRTGAVAVVVGPPIGSGVYYGNSKTPDKVEAEEVAYLTSLLGRPPDEDTGGVHVWWLKHR